MATPFRSVLVLAGDQDERGLLVVLLGPPLGLDDAGLPLVVPEQDPVAHRGLPVGQRLAHDAAAADLVVVHDHEAAGGGDVLGQVAGDGAVELEDALGHVVPLDGGPLLGGVERRGVHDAEDLLDPRGDARRAQLEQVLLALDHRLLAEPEEAHPEPGGDLRARLVLERRHLAARDVDLLLQREARPPAPASARRLRRPVEGLDALDPALLARGVEDHLVAHLHRAGVDGARHDAPVVALLGELVDVLDRHAERLVDRRRLAVERVQRIEHRGPVVPREVGRSDRRCCRRRARRPG